MNDWKVVGFIDEVVGRLNQEEEKNFEYEMLADLKKIYDGRGETPIREALLDLEHD